MGSGGGTAIHGTFRMTSFPILVVKQLYSLHLNNCGRTPSVRSMYTSRVFLLCPPPPSPLHSLPKCCYFTERPLCTLECRAAFFSVYVCVRYLQRAKIEVSSRFSENAAVRHR